MASYDSFSGVDSPLEAFGLKGSYIWIAIGTLTGIFILAVLLSNTKVSVLLSVTACAMAALGALRGLASLSKRFGLYGMMKIYAAQSLPVYTKNNLILKMLLARRKEK